MLQAAKLSIKNMRNSILIYGSICCIFYIVFLLLMRVFNLMETTELRMVNYFIMWAVTFFQIKKWIKETGKHIPFLQVYCVVFFTGVFSYFLFSVFLFLYAHMDPYVAGILAKHAAGLMQSMPSVIVLFEGAGASIIIALINMIYFSRYEEGEVSIEK